MKKLVCLFLIILVSFGLSACSIQNADPQKILNAYEKFIIACGKTQVTDDNQLIGKRTLTADTYVGTYVATCENASGRDVVFGGGSLKQRTIKVTGDINMQSGKVTLSVRLGEKKEVIPIKENGSFNVILDLEGGGNYIMLDYEDFKGTVNIYSSYEGV